MRREMAFIPTEPLIYPAEKSMYRVLQMMEMEDWIMRERLSSREEL